MSTFLEGVQDLAVECDLASLPSAVTGQTGTFRKLVKWYRDAYTDIQNRTDWRWLRHGFTFNTVASTGSYDYTDATDSTSATTIDRFGSWLIQNEDDPPKIYTTASGVGTEYWLIYSEWEEFKRVYKIGTQTEGKPAHITVDPQDNIHLGPIPDAIYTVTGEYYRSPQILAADADTPEMPADFHPLIEAYALFQYGLDEAAPEKVEAAKMLFNRRVIQLEAREGPVMMNAGSWV